MALGPVWVLGRRSLPPPRPREHFTCFDWPGQDGTAGENVGKFAKTVDMFGPNGAATFTFVCVVVVNEHWYWRGVINAPFA